MTDARGSTVPAETVAPASAGQRQLWLHDRLYAHDGTYNIPLGVRLRGILDHDVLRRSFNEVVRRHEILRTAFAQEGDDLLQVIVDEVVAPLPLIGVDQPTPDESLDWVRAQFQADGATPFELSQSPLIRARLYRLAPTDHVLTFVVHHSAFDGWSVDVLLAELGAIYTAFSNGHPSPLPDLQIQFADFAEWQRQLIESGGFAEALERTRQRLSGAPTHIELPIDHPRRLVGGRKGGLLARETSAELRRALNDLARQEGVTLFMVLMSGFAALLHRYSGQDDLLVAAPVAGRTRQEVEPLIGFFVNTVLLRMRLEGNPTFRELLGRVRSAVIEGYADQETPFDLVSRVVQPTRSATDTSALQVMLALQSATTNPTSFGACDASLIWEHNGTAKFDLLLNVVENAAGLQLELEYDSELFESSTIERWLQHYETLLLAAVADPARPIDVLPLLPTQEHQLIVERWNSTAIAYPADSMLHTMMERQAQRTPELMAVECEGQSLTYRELDRLSNQLSHRLRALSVGPEILVGVCLERSLALVVSLLGILKAGAAYVPMDPEYPAERLAFMLEDAEAPVLITTRALAARVATGTTKVVLIDEEWDRLRTEPATKPDEHATPDNLAYMIYTSGSTGRPKGALNTHRAICNRLLWMRDLFSIGPGTVILQKTPVSFDVSVPELFLPFATGARMVLAKPGGHRDPAYLIDLVARRSVTMMHFVPSMLRVFLDQPDVERCRTLTHVMCSGEALPADLCAAFLKRLSCGFYNLYGPTETAVEVTFWDCRQPSHTPTVPIGRPIANTQMYVLDAHLQPTPIGVPGELYIGGVQVGRGYHKRAELTAQRFIPDPFTGGTGRLYKTGDRCRWLSDGTIDFLGRLDRQVKVRGFRIEPGEIEDALRTSGLVRDAVVEVRTDVEIPRLAAYVVPAAGTNPTPGDLREYVKQRLPDYMVPSEFAFLAELPLMANGKIDRASLPRLTAGDAPRPEDVTFANEVEAELARIWTEVLGVPTVKPTDDFFLLGGHSLLAIKLFSRMRETMGVELPFGLLLRHPTIAELAKAVEGYRAQAVTQPSVVALRESGTRPPLFLVHGVGAEIWSYMALTRHLGEDQPVYGLQPVALPDESTVTVGQLAARYVEEIKSVAPDGPFFLAGHCSGAATALEMARLLSAQGDRVALVAIVDYWVFDTSERRPLRRLVDFLENLPPWIAEDLAKVGPATILGRIRSKLRLFSARLRLKFGGGKGPDIRDRLGMWRFPEYQTRSLERYFDAFAAHRPQPYDGDVLVVRAKARALFAPRQSDDMGWSRVINGKVTVREIHGSHETIMSEPLVKGLALVLRDAIDGARTGEAVRFDRIRISA
jgi:amino acid adenylation domain-containing protein